MEITLRIWHMFRTISVQHEKIIQTCDFFRTISVHSFEIFHYLCTGKSKQNSANMAGTVKDMSLIKQVLQLKQLGESNRGIAKKLPINKETVNSYMSKVESNKWKIDELLQVDDLELERMFHAGSPAYTDVRKQDFLSMLPYIKEQLSDPKNHVTRQVLYDEYKQKFPNGYGQSQFYHHLKQNLVAKKDVVAVLSNTYKPGEKLMVDFAGDKLGYVNVETGEMVKVEVFVATMPYSDYTYVVCVPSQKTEDFLYAIRMCLEHLGGVPPILTPDNLKSAVISNDRHEPKLNKALEDMGNYYHFVVLPCDPVSPTQKALVEDAVRISHSRIHAKLRNRTFYSLLELNQAVWELMEKHNQTRMQKRPYSFYSVPYIHVGKQARVVYTRSWVNIYVDNRQVASHLREYGYGFTTIKEHMASNCRIIMERSAAYYIEKTKWISADCHEYVKLIFDPQRTNQPEEIYYKLCDSIISLKRKYELDVFNLTCRQCIEYKVFSYRQFEAILKRNQLYAASEESVNMTAPTPTSHGNMRGKGYFAKTSV